MRSKAAAQMINCWQAAGDPQRTLRRCGELGIFGAVLVD